MKNWNTQTIADLGKVVTGKTPPSAKPEQFGEDFPFVTPSDIKFGNKHTTTERFLSERGIEAHKRIQLPKKTVCVVCIGATIGKVCATDQLSVSNQQINSIIVDAKKHDPDFVFYIASLLRSTLEAYAGGAATPIVNKGAFSKIKLQVPERPIQRKIAAILTAYDDLIETNKRRIALLEKMAEELYREWFVRMRFPGHQNTKFVKGVPEGWEYDRINTLVDFQSGYSFKSETYIPFGRFGVVTIKNVHDGTFIPDCSDSLDEAPSNMKRHCYLSGGDILLSLTGNVGRVCRVYGNNLLLNQRVAKLKPLRENSRCFVYCFFKQPHLMTFCEMIATGAAQQNLSPIKLGNQKTVIPTADLLEEFEVKVHPIFEQSTLLLELNRTLTQTRDLLLPRLISGKLSVEDLDIQFPPSMREEATKPEPANA